jgi:hypothetical protein
MYFCAYLPGGLRTNFLGEVDTDEKLLYYLAVGIKYEGAPYGSGEENQFKKKAGERDENQDL